MPLARRRGRAQRLADAGIVGVPVGTVDKFQGREAAIAIVSLAASSAVEVPRGLEFLLLANRLNVAIVEGSVGRIPSVLARTDGGAAHQRGGSRPVECVHPAGRTVSSWSRAKLEGEGFVGWVTFSELSTVQPPRAPGVYVVVRASTSLPEFLAESVGGRFKGLDPTVTRDILAFEWVEQAAVVYIGKATNLRKRLGQYRKFGEGKPIGHRGGRYIWQLADYSELIVAWRETPEKLPHVVESRMIAEFKLAHGGRRPFANLKD